MSGYDDLDAPPSAEPLQPAVPDELPVRQLDDDEPPEPEAVEMVTWEGKQWPRKFSVPLSEERYVAQALSHPALLDRERAERYARWRFNGFLAGQIASL